MFRSIRSPNNLSSDGDFDPPARGALARKKCDPSHRCGSLGTLLGRMGTLVGRLHYRKLKLGLL